MNSENDEETRLRHRNLAKRQMPYIENYFVPVTETLNTMAGIHINRRTGLGFLLRMFGGQYWKMNPSMR